MESFTVCCKYNGSKQIKVLKKDINKLGKSKQYCLNIVNCYSDTEAEEILKIPSHQPNLRELVLRKDWFSTKNFRSPIQLANLRKLCISNVNNNKVSSPM